MGRLMPTVAPCGWNPSNQDVIAHIDRLAESSGRWADLAAVYDAEIDRILDSRLQTEMLLRLAASTRRRPTTSTRPSRTYRRVADAEPDRKDGLEALDRLYTRTERWTELADVVRGEIRLADTDNEIIELTFRLAQILEVALGDMPKAVEAYQDILNIDPKQAETRATLERLLANGTMQREIAQVLEPLYRVGEEWEKLVRIYQVELGVESDAQERQRLLRRLAEIFEAKLMDQVAALEWWSKAVVEDPASEQGLDELLRLARTTHQWETYVASMADAAARASDHRVRRDVLFRLATVFDTELADLVRVEDVLGRCWRSTPMTAKPWHSSIGSTTSKATTRNWRTCCAGALPSTMGRGNWSRCISALARSWPMSSTTRRERWPAIWR